jgi:hypothetical protein
VDLVHDVLDKQVIDKCEMPVGRVDGIVLELREGAPPRVAFVEIGGTVFARRLHPRLARWAAAIRRRWGRGEVSTTRIPWSALRRKGMLWEADLDGRDTHALDWEVWLREHVIVHVPGRGK